jgi:hypothetical protein
MLVTESAETGMNWSFGGQDGAVVGLLGMKVVKGAVTRMAPRSERPRRLTWVVALCQVPGAVCCALAVATALMPPSHQCAGWLLFNLATNAHQLASWARHCLVHIRRYAGRGGVSTANDKEAHALYTCSLPSCIVAW